MKEKINPFTPGLVIMPNGEMIPMKEGEDKHKAAEKVVENKTDM